MVDFNTIAERLLTYQNDTINLTEQDYDATPIVISSETVITLSIDLKIEEDNATSTDTLIWNHSTKGLWNQFKWGPRTPSWTVVEELINI